VDESLTTGEAYWQAAHHMTGATRPVPPVIAFLA
jgi:hypothetical protein